MEFSLFQRDCLNEVMLLKAGKILRVNTTQFSPITLLFQLHRCKSTALTLWTFIDCKDVPLLYFCKHLAVCFLMRFSLGGENLAVAQNTYSVNWFKGKELNMVFGLQLSFSRVVSFST